MELKIFRNNDSILKTFPIANMSWVPLLETKCNKKFAFFNFSSKTCFWSVKYISGRWQKLMTWPFVISSRKTRLSPQTSIEQADAQSRPQVSKEMLPVHWQDWTCLSNATLECTSPAKRIPLKAAIMNSTFTTKTRANKYTHRLKYGERTLLKNWKIQKKLKYKVSKNKHKTDENKNNQIHLQIKIQLMNITQIGKCKTLKKTEIKKT